MRHSAAENLHVLLTFPGIVAHEWAHKKFCDWFGVRVHKVVYFNIRSLFAVQGQPLGYVVFDEPNTFFHTLLISMGPLILNSTLAVVFGFVAFRVAHGIVAQLMLCWVALSIGMHAFPSNRDAKNVLDRSKQEISKNDAILHYLSYPFYRAICFMNGARRWWIDLTYAVILVGMGSRLPASSSVLHVLLPAGRFH